MDVVLIVEFKIILGSLMEKRIKQYIEKLAQQSSRL